jgi:hypothetical protein
MKQWYYAAQALFKKWIEEQELSKNCLTQKIGLNKLVEEYEVWPKTGGAPTLVRFEANRLTSTYCTCEVTKDGKKYDL